MRKKLLLEAQWSSKNEKEFSNYREGSGYKAFWEHICDCGEKHEWQARVCDRYNYRNCARCSGKGPNAQICPCKSLQKLRPDLMKEWDFSKNKITPDKITLKSDRKVWWLCDKSNCKHEHSWEASVANRTAKKQNGCPYCSKNKICICNSLSSLQPHVASQWHPTRNKLKSEEVSISCNYKVWWLCDKSNCEHPHEWKAHIYDMTGKKFYGCPYCSKHKICICNSLARLKPDVASQWHPTKNKLKPEEVSISSNYKVWWLCDKSDCDHPHEWLTSVGHRTGKNARNCPFCSKQKYCSCNSLDGKRPDITAEWHPTKNEIGPYEVSQFSKRKVWWICKLNHEYESSVNNRVRGGNGCPFCCESKGEKHVREILTKMNLNFVSQKRISYRECKRLRFDFFLPGHNVAIEFDGLQHFEPVEFFGGKEQFEIQKRNDLYKRSFCQETGTSLVRIHYKDTNETEQLIDFATSAKFRSVLLSKNHK